MDKNIAIVKINTSITSSGPLSLEKFRRNIVKGIQNISMKSDENMGPKTNIL